MPKFTSRHDIIFVKQQQIDLLVNFLHICCNFLTLDNCVTCVLVTGHRPLCYCDVSFVCI